MKVGGVEAKRRGQLPPLVFNRDEGEHLVFIAQPVYDLDEFNALCPMPDPKKFGVYTKDGWQTDYNAPGYLDLLQLRQRQQWSYIVIKTLEPSDIQWEKVKIEDPKTWHHWDEEIRSIVSFTEYSRVISLVEEANCLDPAKLEANRERFFQKQATAKNSNCPSSDPDSTQSGQHVACSVSNPPE